MKIYDENYVRQHSSSCYYCYTYNTMYIKEFEYGIEDYVHVFIYHEEIHAYKLHRRKIYFSYAGIPYFRYNNKRYHLTKFY